MKRKLEDKTILFAEPNKKVKIDKKRNFEVDTTFEKNKKLCLSIKNNNHIDNMVVYVKYKRDILIYT